MKILVMENTTSYHEVAAETIKACGFEPICVDNIIDAMQLLNEVDAVITDLYFHVPPCATHHPSLNVSLNEPPAGLIIAVACANLGKPYVVFTQQDGHRYDCWWVQAAQEGYRLCKVEEKLFPSVVTGTKQACESWAGAVHRLCNLKFTEGQLQELLKLEEKYPSPDQEESRRICGIDWLR
jgi:hypothetical protein